MLLLPELDPPAPVLLPVLRDDEHDPIPSHQPRTGSRRQAWPQSHSLALRQAKTLLTCDLTSVGSTRLFSRQCFILTRLQRRKTGPWSPAAGNCAHNVDAMGN